MKVNSPLVEESTYQANLLHWYRDKALGQRLNQQLSEALNDAEKARGALDQHKQKVSAVCVGDDILWD